MVKCGLLFSLLLFSFYLDAQTLGGSSQYNFLKAAASPQLSALGGINISQQSDDIGLAFQNPSQLQDKMSGQMQAIFHSLPGSIRNYNLITGYKHKKLNTNFGIGVQFFDYGNTVQTDAGGSVLGNFRPTDYSISLMASRTYMERWRYGASLKFIHSSYGIYRSAAVALDVAITYTDTAHLLQMAFVAQNMGTQIKSYDGTTKGDLPFDIRLGISKKLAKAPLQFSLTLHQLQNLNNRYADTTDTNPNGNASVSKGFVDGAFRHIVLATQLFIGDKIEVSAGYNYLRRKELNIGNAGNGLNGFSLGVGIILKKWQFRYSRANYQNSIVNHQVGLTFSFSNFSGKSK